MAVFTELSFEEAAAFATALGLDKVQSVKMCEGIENSSYFIDTLGGEFLLTLFGNMSLEQLPFYLHLMKHLAGRGIPVPCPVADADGQILHLLKGKPAAVVNTLSGASEMAPTLTHCHAVGSMLARMHLAGGDYERFQPDPQGLAWWNDTVAMLLPHVTGDERNLMSEELSLQNHIALSKAYHELPRGAVHANLCRHNVLFDDGELSGFFDFYFASTATFIYDIGVCLNDWCVHPATGRDDADSILTFLNAYQVVRKLTPQEVRLLPVLRRAAALRFWLSRLHDVHMPRRARILNAHGPRHFERVLRALRSTYPQE
jgi:homoserine kinase type II